MSLALFCNLRDSLPAAGCSFGAYAFPEICPFSVLWPEIFTACLTHRLFIPSALPDGKSPENFIQHILFRLLDFFIPYYTDYYSLYNPCIYYFSK